MNPTADDYVLTVPDAHGGRALLACPDGPDARMPWFETRADAEDYLARYRSELPRDTRATRLADLTPREGGTR